MAASAATTVFGFFALIFMRFGIGSDLGMNLVKGVTISYISVVVFLPALALRTVKLLDKTAHRRIIAAPHGIGARSLRCAYRRLFLCCCSSYRATLRRAAQISCTATATLLPTAATGRTHRR